MNQGEAFMEGEGDAWHVRNKDKPHDTRVMNAIIDLKLKPQSVLEIGCGNGWRLKLLQDMGARVVGLEPSQEAIRDAKINGIFQGTAADIPEFFLKDNFDLVIFGFCLYLVDREDLMKVADYSDHVLRDGGHIIIHDFFSFVPIKRPYEHKEGLFSYKQDYSELWTCNPAYEEIDRTKIGIGGDCVAVHVLRKNMDGWILEET